MNEQWADEELLALSGIQHFAFCERQWALIHIEGIWAENDRTTAGNILHERVDDPFFSESRGDRFIARAVPIVSRRLGLSGIADVVEFQRTGDAGNGVVLAGRSGCWYPVPIEYKRGRPKAGDHDMVQLVAQAICLEEMLTTTIETGYLYYGQTRRRYPVPIDQLLRQRVAELAAKMHQVHASGLTPRPQAGVHCRRCSLMDQCLPTLGKRQKSATGYIKRSVDEIRTERS